MANVGRLILSIAGYELTAAEIAVIKHPNTAGIILFEKNYKTATQLKSLVQSIKSLARETGKDQDFPVLVDYEGGHVQRYRHPKYFPIIPCAAEYGEVYDDNPTAGLNMARRNGYRIGAKCREYGLIPLTPIADRRNGSTVIEGCARAMHKDARICSELVSAHIEGLQFGGVHATLKHFPGHGSVEADSHIAYPVDNRSEAELRTDLSVFANNMPQSGAVMPAHVLYPAIDPDNIATFSSIWQNQILRTELQSSATTISDCLAMKGAGDASDFDKITRTLEYIDIALLCHKPADYALELLDLLAEDYKQSPEMYQRFSNWVKGPGTEIFDSKGYQNFMLAEGKHLEVETSATAAIMQV